MKRNNTKFMAFALMAVLYVSSHTSWAQGPHCAQLFLKSKNELQQSLSPQEVARILPHKKPILLVERIHFLRKSLGKKDTEKFHIESEMYIHPKHPLLKGHFPGRPIFPGVGTLEAMAQTAAFHFLYYNPSPNKVPVFAQADKVKWKGMLVPGDHVSLYATLIASYSGAFAKYKVWAEKEGQIVAEAQITAVITEMNRPEPGTKDQNTQQLDLFSNLP